MPLFRQRLTCVCALLVRSNCWGKRPIAAIPKADRLLPWSLHRSFSMCLTPDLSTKAAFNTHSCRVRHKRQRLT